MSLDHVGLNVADLNSMTAWYADLLSLEVEFEVSVDDIELSIVMLRSTSGYRLELLSRVGSAPGLRAEDPAAAALTEGFGHIAFHVPDVVAAYDHFVGAGAIGRMSPRPAPEPGVQMAFVSDPEGNLVELLQRATTNS